MNIEYLWYVTYGPDMASELFMKKIEGGYCGADGKIYNGSADKSPPIKNKPYLIPYELYFGNKSGVWDGGGVAFIDQTKSGVTLGRAYLITEEQFLGIREQENDSRKWYGNTVALKRELYDYIHITFTQSPENRDENPPHGNYLKAMRQGLIETYPQLELFSI